MKEQALFVHLWNVPVALSQLKLKAMTSKEILRSSFLEILFQNRNKEYGAYPLRKYYDNRLGIALVTAISFVFLMLLLATRITSKEAYSQSVFEKDGVVINPVHLPEPVQPKPPVQRGQALIKNTPIDIVKNLLHTEVSANGQLDLTNQVSSVTQAGSNSPELPSIEAAIPALTPTEAEIQKPALITSAPQFPGGQQAWLLFLTKHLRTPDELEGGERKTVLVKFVVSVDGTITEFTVVQSGGAALDNEVIRVLKKMPRWKPAVQNGQVVTTAFTQPVTFQAVEE